MNKLLVAIAVAALWLPCISVDASIMNVNHQEGSDALDTILQVIQDGDDLKFTLTVDASVTGNIADLRAFYFDIADESLLSGLSVSGTHITDFDFTANNVDNLGGGTVINPLGPFDGGVEIGTSGKGKDDIQTTMFTLSHSSFALDVDTFFRQSNAVDDYIVAVRGTSVGSATGGRSGSSKTGGSNFSQPTPEPTSIVIWMCGMGALGLVRQRRSIH